MITWSRIQQNNEGDGTITLKSTIGQKFNPYNYLSVKACF